MINQRKYNAKFLAYEKLYLKKFQSTSNYVLNSVISDLKKHGLQTAKQNLTTLLVNDKLTPVLESIYKRVGLEGARWTLSDLRLEQKASFGRNESWVRLVIDYLRLNILNFAAKITDTLKSDILKIIEKAVEEGKGISEIVKELRETGLLKARAAVIARTEIVRAANVGHSIGAKSFPYEVNKKWISAKDHRVRHSHRFVNNHVTDEQGTFRVPVYKGDTPTGQTDLMQFPGDPEAHPSNTINCRCRVIYEPKRDAKGNLIRRTTPAIVVPMKERYIEYEDARIAASARKAIIDNISVDVE